MDQKMEAAIILGSTRTTIRIQPLIPGEPKRSLKMARFRQALGLGSGTLGLRIGPEDRHISRHSQLIPPKPPTRLAF